MKLHEMAADQILAALEERGDAYVEAKHNASMLEAAYDRTKAAVYGALRKAGGGSVDDCKAAVLDSETVIAVFNDYMAAEREKDRAYLALERSRIAAEMWRSEQANRRRV